MGNYYDFLGVRADASVDLIDRAYRNRAVDLHPDKNPDATDEAKKRFQQLQRAYETLSNSHRRYYYNAAHCRLKSGWFLVPMDAELREMRFNSDGSFVLKGKQFRPDDSVRAAVTFSGTNKKGTFRKAAGPAEELILSGPGVTERYRFHDGRWYCWVPADAVPIPSEEEKSTKQNAASPQLAISTVVFTSDDGPPSPSQGNATDAPRSKRKVFRWSAIAAALLLALGAGWGLKGLQHQGAAPGTIEERQLAVADRAKQLEIEEKERQQREAELRASHAKEAAETQHKIDIARNRDRLLTLVRRSDEMLKLHGELVAEQRAWEETVPPLLTNDDGRKLATEDKYVRTFMEEYRKRWPSRESIAALRVEIEKLIAPIREAAADTEPAYSPATDIDATLNQKRTEIEKMLADFRASRSLITSLIASIGQRSDRTLTAAMDAVVKADELERAQRIAEKTAQARRDRDELEADIQKRKMEANVTHQAELARAADAEEARKTQKLKDRTEAQSAEVRSVLAYFFAKDTFQPVRNISWAGMEAVGKAQPISLSRLQTCGALNESQEGLQTLLSIVTNSWDQSRPLWGISASLDGITPADTEKLSKAQDYLNRLGPTLVELGLLSE